MFERIFPSRHVRDFRRRLLAMRPAYGHHIAWDALASRLSRSVAADRRLLKRRVQLEGVPMSDIVFDAIAGACLADLEIGQDVQHGVMGSSAQSQVAIFRQAIAQRRASGRMNDVQAQAAHDMIVGAMEDVH